LETCSVWNDRSTGNVQGVRPALKAHAPAYSYGTGLR
jgi:hypothetical protein